MTGSEAACESAAVASLMPPVAESKVGEDMVGGKPVGEDVDFHTSILDNLFAERKAVGISRKMAEVMIDATESELDVLYKLPAETTEES